MQRMTRATTHTARAKKMRAKKMTPARRHTREGYRPFVPHVSPFEPAVSVYGVDFAKVVQTDEATLNHLEQARRGGPASTAHTECSVFLDAHVTFFDHWKGDCDASWTMVTTEHSSTLLSFLMPFHGHGRH